MKINDNNASSLLTPASPRAQEVRKSASQVEAPGSGRPPAVNVSETPSAGNNTQASGNILPAAGTDPQSAQSVENAKGIANAIEQLQKNIEKNPQANGLLRALETLTERQSTAVAVDTEA